MRARSTLVLALSLFVVAMVACSDDEGSAAETAPTEPTTVPAETFVAGVCTAMTDYNAQVQSITDAFTASLSPTAPLQDQKDAVAAYIGEVVEATQAAVEDIRAAGVPDVGVGDQVSAALDDAFAEATAALEELRTEIEGLSVDDPQAFGTALLQLSTEIQTALDETGTALESLDTQELSEVAADEPACAQFVAGVGTT